MSSALKPVLTPSGAQNSSVPPQMNKPMHPQGASTTYGQSMSHLPQNLVNIPHNPPNSANLHNPVHTVSNHNTNHYSLNVPNASQHYTTVSGVTPNSNANQTTSPSKNSTFNPTFQQNIGNSYKTPTVTTPPPPPPLPLPAQTPTTNLPSSQPPPSVSPSTTTTTTTDTTTVDKPQSNGTQESNDSNNSEVPQNYSMSQTVKEKVEPPPQCTAAAPSPPEKSKETKDEVVATPTVISSATEQPKTNIDVNKSPPEVINSSPSPDKSTCTPTGSSTGSVNNVATESLPTVTNATATTTTTVNSTTVSPTQANQPPPISSLPTESATTQETASPATTTATKPKEQASQKSPVKLATTPRTPTRKPKSPKLETSDSPKTPKSVTEGKAANQKSPSSTGKAKRNRIKTQPYQCPLPEVELISKISVTTPKSKNSEDKLIIFYKNEFLAVRNSEGGFYICQAVQNIYKSSPRIRIRWLSQDKTDKEAYSPDFYDYTDFDCILTNLNLSRMDKGKYRLPANERIRTDSILKRALAVEQGDATPPSLTEEHPDGLDLSLYKEESQLKKRKSLKRKATSSLKSSPSSSSSGSKSPDQAKVRKLATKSKSPPVKKSTVLKRALSAKTKKFPASTRAERASKRKLEVTAVSPKTSPVMDHKKAKVLAKVARRAAVIPPKVQAPPKPISKANKQVASTSKKSVPVTKKEKAVAVIRKSKRGKK